ncbi:MaoC/PaaZ C-terminal domain-containing protein [Streptomyces sp. B6B3]|uniref:MaoC family dehydratase n=1 Tax=Streptomyces sp. B6B3 TaxID=3153570 RepID=UPI00325F3352
MRTVEEYFDDYEIGRVRTTTGRTVTEADIVLHAGQTGDLFPHHMDAAWCATQPFQRRMAHGTLVMSLAVGMTAGDINPRAMSYGYERVRFVQPVFIGDTLRVRAEITTKREHPRRPLTHGFVDETVTAVNQEERTVLSLVHVYLVERQPGETAAEEPEENAGAPSRTSETSGISESSETSETSER